MPGANCSVFGCPVSRRHKNVSIFKVPEATNDFKAKWRQEIINVITRDREMDDSFRKQIQSGTLYVCERHFSTDQMWCYSEKKTLKDNAIPSLNLPQKSIVSAKPVKRSDAVIQKREQSLLMNDESTSAKPPSSCYKSYVEFQQRISKLKLGKLCSIDQTDELTVITIASVDTVIPKFEIFVEPSLRYTVRVFGWMLTKEHEIYTMYDRSFSNVTLSDFISQLGNYYLCPGLVIPDPKFNLTVKKHIVPKIFSFHDYDEQSMNSRVCEYEYSRSSSCFLLVIHSVGGSNNMCSSCRKNSATLTYEHNRKQAKKLEPAKLNAPIASTDPQRLKLTIQGQREIIHEQKLECKQLKAELEKMRESIQKHSQPVNKELNSDLVTIFKNSHQKNVPDFMKLFWQEQQKYINSTSASSVRYHPMIIKFCLALHAKSASAYNELRYDSKNNTGVLVLPSERTLRDYKNYIRPKRGFNDQIVDDLRKKTERFSEAERYVTILLDEMKIQEDLVWDKHTGELIGFVDLGDIKLNYATLKDVSELATHILVFLVKSVVNPLSYSFATFATTGITAFQIFPLFWKTVNILENMNLKVIAATADGASPNRKFFRMHKPLDGDAEKAVVYRTLNLFSSEKRYIYFFSDAPHLIKTVRNCLSNSGSNRCTRFMWNNGFYILWSHITSFVHRDMDFHLSMLTKLTSDHINLTPFSVMRVRLAAQVLSETVGTVLKSFGPPETEGTGEFCLMMDKFFDCLNVRNKEEYKDKRKPFLKPYESVDDIRFAWLDQFLNYFEQWKQSIEDRPGDFTQNAKSNMFISWQSYEGLQITVNSFREVCKFLLQHGIPYILSERFCQDDLENYFGRQRSLCQRNTNPDVMLTGYNDNTIKCQYSVRPIAGNVRANINKFNDIDDTPLPKRSKAKKD